MHLDKGPGARPQIDTLEAAAFLIFSLGNDPRLLLAVTADDAFMIMATTVQPSWT